MIAAVTNSGVWIILWVLVVIALWYLCFSIDERRKEKKVLAQKEALRKFPEYLDGKLDHDHGKFDIRYREGDMFDAQAYTLGWDEQCFMKCANSPTHRYFAPDIVENP